MKHKIVLAVPIMLAITLTKVKADNLPVVSNEDSTSDANESVSYTSNYDPKGVFDTAESASNILRVTGWAFDRDDVNATEKIEVYIDDSYLGTISTDSERKDVNDDQNITGVHGFIGEFQTSLTGVHQVSIWAVDLNEDHKVLLGTKTVSLQGDYTNYYLSQGFIDSITSNKPGTISLVGWAFDLDMPEESIKVKVYASGHYIGEVLANSIREDVNDTYSIQGLHGYNQELTTDLTGLQTISIYAVDPLTNYERLIGSKNVNIQAPVTYNYEPKVWLDSITSNSPNSVDVQGWIFDQDDVSKSLEAKIYVDNELVDTLSANQSREDVNSLYHITGNHGFSGRIKVNVTGVHTVKIVTTDLNTDREVIVGSMQVNIQADPNDQYSSIGNSDVIKAEGQWAYYIAGWAYDLDTIGSNVQINVYNNDKLETTLTANQIRKDVNDAFNITGNHGYSGRITTDTSGLRTITLKMVDPVTKKEKLLASEEIEIEKSYTTSYQPEGCLDLVVNSQEQSFYIAGWAYDLDDLSSNVAVNIYANGELITTLQANQVRDDVNRVKGTTGTHGFSGTISTNLSGKQTITAKMVDLGTKKEYTIGSETIELQKSYTTYYEPKGNIDTLTSSNPKQVSTSGWAFDQDDLSAAVEVEIYEGDTLIKSISADRLREDLNSLYKITGNHGFDITFETNLTGEHTFTYKLKDLGTGKETVLGTKSVVIQKSFTSNFDPVGCIDGAVSNKPGEIFVSGWIFDRDDLTSNCVVKVYDGNTLIGTLPANQIRNDVNSLYKIIGNHGFGGTILTKLYGKHDLTFKMVDLGTNKEIVLGTRSVEIQSSYTTSYKPFGVVDMASYDESGVFSYGGWAFDKDDLSSSVEIRIYDGSTLLTTASASQVRNDVNSVYKTTGNHGFSGSFKTALTSGDHTIHFKAVDLGSDSEYEIGSQNINVKKTFTNQYKVTGCLDSLTLSTSGIASFTGWAFDKDDLSESIEIEIYDGNTLLGTIKASDERNDVNTAYKTTGSHGFNGMVLIKDLNVSHTLIVKAKNLGDGSEVELGRKTFNPAGNITLTSSKSYTTNSLVTGWVDSIIYSGGKLAVAGWAYDADSINDTVSIKIYADNTLIGTLNASDPRSDVNQAFGITGNHGINGTITTSLTGVHNVKICAVDLGTGKEVEIKNQNIAFNAVTNASLPVGVVDYITPLSNNQVSLFGWCYDPDSPSTSLSVKVYCDGVWITTISCNRNRTDVNSTYGLTGVHGFEQCISLSSSGTHTIELYAVDVNGKDTQRIGYSTITTSAATAQHLAIAYTQLGTVGGVKYNTYWGIGKNSAWCASFVSWCASQAGILNTKIPKFYWCDNGYYWFLNKNLLVHSNPKPGYIIFFDYADSTGYRDGVCDHVGIVDSVDSTHVYTIEGNRGTNSDPSLNKVATGSYSLNDPNIRGYGIVQ